MLQAKTVSQFVPHDKLLRSKDTLQVPTTHLCNARDHSICSIFLDIELISLLLPYI